MTTPHDILRAHITPNALVHAYGLEGDVEVLHTALSSLLHDAFGVVTAGNPDVHIRRYETMGIDEARALEDTAVLKPLTGERSFFIVSCGGITHEAQNALLKVLEEPTAGTHFFFLMPNLSLLLPTLRSRLYSISAHTTEGKEGDVAEFLKANYSRRLKLVKRFIDEKDKAGALRFLNQLEHVLHGTLSETAHPSHEISVALRDIARARSYLSDRAPSVKMLLEQVALSIPAP